VRRESDWVALHTFSAYAVSGDRSCRCHHQHRSLPHCRRATPILHRHDSLTAAAVQAVLPYALVSIAVVRSFGPRPQLCATEIRGIRRVGASGRTRQWRCTRSSACPFCPPRV